MISDEAPQPDVLADGQQTGALAWSVTETDAACVVTLHGELDADTAPRLRRLLHGLVLQSRRLIVDTTALNFCASSGMTVLLETHDRAQQHGGELRVVIPPSAHLHRVWTMLGLDALLPPFATVAAASR
ncbi:MAG: anti-sigma factor antagonist [Pseudonocardiales bacterium]|jgi:anti-sigma B factor antagonist|nr:anti-sigma factor antagonist [Pseudonocardiales bacterium]